MNRFGTRSRGALLVASATLTLAGCLQVQAPPKQDASKSVAAAAVAHDASDKQDIDSGPYPKFGANPAIAGTVRCVGSSAVGLILNAMRRQFAEAEPDIALEVISSGSGEAPKALANGTSDLAPMSRSMKPEEIAAIEKARGCKVESIDIAVDAIAVCVNRHNPITQLSMKDLDRVFGRERRRGGGPAVVWGDLGLQEQPWASQKILIFGMGPNTGSNGIMREVVLDGGSFRTSANEEPVASGVVSAVATNTNAIGYCSSYFQAARVRALLLEATDGSGFVGPTDEAIRSGRYPLSRSLRIYFVRDPVRPNPAAMQFLRFLVSEDGQTLVGELGQKRISPEAAHESFRLLGR